MDAYELTATEALARFKDKSLTIESYARSILSRIAKRDETVKAWAHFDAEYVLEQAKKLDQVAFENRGPIHGVAIAVKDIIYTRDMPTQFNSPIYAGNSPELDAACITVLRNAGALLLGKTTTAEFAATNKGPKTCNPHDPNRTPGGSSSGSGAAVGDFQAPIALATQTGGSCIRPASFNGIYAIKPTWNTVSREGVKIYSLLFDTLGIYARSVQDLELIAEVFALKDDEPVLAPFNLTGARFALIKSPVWPEAGKGTTSAIAAGTNLLRKHGAEVEEIDLPPEFENLPRYHRTWLAAEGRTAFLSEYCIAKPKLNEFLVGHVENRNEISRKEQLKAFDSIASLRPRIDEIAGNYAAILTPSAPDEAPIGIDSTGSSIFNLMWTALHVPVVNIPGFKGEHGMPIGLSLVGPRYRDRQLLAVASAVGRAFEEGGGWKRAVS